jgi:hypothetical protein
MAYGLSPSTSAVKVPPYITANDTNYIETFASTDLDTTSRPATPPIDTIGLYSIALHFHNTGANSLSAYKIYGAKDLSGGNVTNTVDISSATTYWANTAVITTLASDAKSFATWKLPGTLPRYIQVYLAAADANKTNMAVTVIANYL